MSPVAVAGLLTVLLRLSGRQEQYVRRGRGGREGVGVGRGHADAVALPQRPPDHVPRGGGGPADGARRLSGRQEQYVRRGRGGREGVGVGRGHADAVALPQRPPDHVPRGGGRPAHGALKAVWTSRTVRTAGEGREGGGRGGKGARGRCRPTTTTARSCPRGGGGPAHGARRLSGRQEQYVRRGRGGREGVGVGRGHADAVALPQRPPDHVPRGGGGPAHGARRLSGRQEQYVQRGRGGRERVWVGRGHADAVALPQRPPDHVPRGSGGPADSARRLSGCQEQYVRRGRGGREG